MISRSKIFFTLCISFLLALLPLTVGNDENKQKAFVSNCAYADAGSFAGAYEFLELASNAAGLSVGDFVATGVGVIAMGTGMTVANDIGAQMGRSAAYSLDCLTDAADYPAWDTLTSEEQSSWGSKTNYDAAKYNSLCSAFGLGDDYEAYKQGYTGSGGSNFEFSTAAQNKLNRLGRIGNNWANGIGNSLDYVKTVIAQEEYIRSYLGADASYAEVDTSGYEQYASSWPSSVNVNQGATWVCMENGRPWYYRASHEVYYVMLYRSGNSLNTVLFSPTQFTWGQEYSDPTSLGNGSGAYTYDNKTVYWSQAGRSNRAAPFTSESMFTYSDTPQTYEFERFVWSLLYGGSPISIGEVPQVPDYPEETTGDEVVFFPSQGVTNNTNWNVFITNNGNSDSVDLSEIVALLNRFNFTSSGDLRVHDSEILTAIQNCCNRFQFYATGQLKVHDEGIFDQLTDVQTTLNQILAKIGLSSDAPDIIGEFDYPELQAKSNTLVEDISTLAPFGSLLVISETVGILSQTEQITEPKLVVPFEFGLLNQDYSVEIDLSWLDPLKPLINALLIMVLVMTLAGVTLRFVELEASA